MCGIAGVADFSGHPIDEGLVARMCAALRHRGPDDEGILHWPDAPVRGRPAVALGSRRLSIIDLEGGHQPISNEDGTVWVVQNGEIYNFQELRRDLVARGHCFSTRSDTEAIVHLYEERGEQFVEALDGMFALAIWDARADTLLLARDRFGKKPLVYAESVSRVVFASELQAVLQDARIPRAIDLDALDDYLSYMAVPAPRTIYTAVRKLPPAHVLVRDRRGTRLRRYWSLRYTPKIEIAEEDAIERIRALVAEAVRKRLISDVPLGAFLSGGVDSSAVVASMAAQSAGRVKTFSIGFEDPRYDELAHARRIARQFGCEHHEFVVAPRAVEVLPTLVRHFGEPFADSSAIPTFYLSRLTRQHVTVALNGDGGDEAFAGYERHLAFGLAERWRSQVPGTLGVAGRAGARLLPPGADRRGWNARIARFLRGAALPRAARYRAWVGIFTDDLKGQLLRAPRAANDGLIESLFDEQAACDGVDSILAVDAAFYLPTDLLVKVDIASMANSLEARSPFLDRDLVEFVARLPSRFKVRGRRTKYLLKRALDGVVPPENLHRRKCGFAVPISSWFRGELREYLLDHLMAPRSVQRGLFRKEKVEELAMAHIRGKADYGHHLWLLLMLELWHREYIDSQAAGRVA